MCILQFIYKSDKNLKTKTIRLCLYVFNFVFKEKILK